METSRFDTEKAFGADDASSSSSPFLAPLASASFATSGRRTAARAAGADEASTAVSVSFTCSVSLARPLSARRAGSAGASLGRPETCAYAPRQAPATSATTNGETPPRFSGGEGAPDETEADVPRGALPGRSREEEGVDREEEDALLASAEDAEGVPEDAVAEDDAEEGAIGASAAVGLVATGVASPGFGLW